MARQNSLFPFTGKLGNVIGYERNGRYFLRSMPETVQQTIATRRAARRFGIASRKGALIRNAFYNELDIRCDSSHVNRLNKVLIAAGNNNEAIIGFRFNQYTGIDKFFNLAPELSQAGTVYIPPQMLAQYKDVSTLEVKVIAARIDFKTGQVIGTDAVVMTIDTREFFGGADIGLHVPGNGTLVVTLQVRALHTNNRQYQAAGIIGVLPPQTLKVFSTYPPQRIIVHQHLFKPAKTYHPVIQRE